MTAEHCRSGDASNREAPCQEDVALTKDLASVSVSRRQALRFMRVALAGGLLAFIPGTAWAQERQGPPTGFGYGPPTMLPIRRRVGRRRPSVRKRVRTER